MDNSSVFLEDSEKKAFDVEHRRKINFNINKYNESVVKGKQQYYNYELARERASFIKTQSIERLDEYLIMFESNFKKEEAK